MGMPPGRGARAKIDDATAIVVGGVIRDDSLPCPCHRSSGPASDRGGLAQRFFGQSVEFDNAHSFSPPYGIWVFSAALECWAVYTQTVCVSCILTSMTGQVL